MPNKLYQCFLLDEESKVQSFLVPNSTGFESAFGPLEFDFHPYKVLALFDKKYELKELPPNLIKLSLNILIVDEELKKPFLLDITASHALLMLSEFIKDIYECFHKVNWNLTKVTPNQSAYLDFSLEISNITSVSALIGQALIIGGLLESLLCARGLMIKNLILEPNSNIDQVLLSTLTNCLWLRAQ